MSILNLTSETLVASPASGQIEYNGQFFGTDSNASRAQMQRITQGTAVASTSGTSIDFTGLPAWVKRVTVAFSAVSTNGTSQVQIQLGSGTVQTTGYRGSVDTSATSVGAATITTGLALERTGGVSAANSRNGTATFVSIGSNIWSGVAQIGYETNQLSQSACAVTLSGTLDRVRITTVNGTDTFDAGSINILYEG
jgi:hypothetical protein